MIPFAFSVFNSSALALKRGNPHRTVRSIATSCRLLITIRTGCLFLRLLRSSLPHIAHSHQPNSNFSYSLLISFIYLSCNWKEPLCLVTRAVLPCPQSIADSSHDGSTAWNSLHDKLYPAPSQQCLPYVYCPSQVYFHFHCTFPCTHSSGARLRSTSINHSFIRSFVHSFVCSFIHSSFFWAFSSTENPGILFQHIASPQPAK